MSRNGSGGYSLPVNTWNPATTGVSATVTDWQALINDIATAMQQSVSSDGQTAMTGNLAMGNNKLTGFSAGTATGHSLRWEQLFSQGTIANLASATTTDIGAQNTSFLNITGTTTITGFGTNYNGPRFLSFTGALTLTHSATLVIPGAANITTAAGDACIVVPISGGWKIVSYDKYSGLPTATTGLATAGDNSNITSLSGLTTALSIAQGGTGQITAALAFAALKQAASDTATGVVEIATASEVQVGTDTGRVLTPGNLRANMIVQTVESATTSGTAVEITGVPSWARRVTIYLDSISTNGTSNLMIQIGDSGGAESSGYLGSGEVSTTAVNFTTGFGLTGATAAASVCSGVAVLDCMDAASNKWLFTSQVGYSNTNSIGRGAGIKALTGTLDRVRITTVGGADTFDAGGMKIAWE